MYIRLSWLKFDQSPTEPHTHTRTALYSSRNDRMINVILINKRGLLKKKKKKLITIKNNNAILNV